MKKIHLLKYIVYLTSNLLSGISISQEFLLGADLSYVNEMEDCGAVYYEEGTEKDPYVIFKEYGANIIRIRLWHDPTEWTNYSTLDDVIKSITRAKNQNLSVLLDLHYSDVWADPSRQWRPKAWGNIDNDIILADSLYEYTYRILNILHKQNLAPNYVQMGNEIEGNILIPIDSSSDLKDKTLDTKLYPVDWQRQVNLLNNALKALKDFNDLNQLNIQSILHVSKPENASYWFDDAISNGLSNFDIIGISYYPALSNLSVQALADEVERLQTDFNKKVLIVETGYPWTDLGNDNAENTLAQDYGIPSTTAQKQYLINLVTFLKNHNGMGLIYWEPAWVTTSCRTLWGKGSHWENVTFFDFNNQLHEGIEFLSYDYNFLTPIPLKKSLSLEFSYFPSPITKYLYVKTTQIFQQLMLVDISGKVWLPEKIIDDQQIVTFDLSPFPSGIYSGIFHFTNGEKKRVKLFKL